MRSSTPRRRPLCLGASFAGSGRRDSPRRGLFLGPLAGEVMMVGRPASRSPFPVDRLDLPMPCSTEPAAGRRRIANTEHARARTGPRGIWVGEWFYLYPPPACPAADSRCRCVQRIGLVRHSAPAGDGQRRARPVGHHARGVHAISHGKRDVKPRPVAAQPAAAPTARAQCG